MISQTSGAITSSGSTTEILFNRIIYITDAFPSGYTAGTPFTFTMTGFTNPANSQPTDSFEIKIYYTEYENEVSHYQGLDLFFQATPSNDITLESFITEDKTGEAQTNFTIVGNLGMDKTIEKQSYLKVIIPRDFRVSDATRVASTCIGLWGFSDEIQCDIEIRAFGYDLYVRNGFDSETFEDRSFGF